MSDVRDPFDLPEPDVIDVLRAASIFRNMPHEVLVEVAARLERIDVPSGQRIFEKGDPGTAMYIIVDGNVRVHDDEMTINYLGTRDVFGEMSAIDSQPRSASVTAAKDTVLYRLDQAAFRNVIAASPEVGLAIVRVLSGHLRGNVAEMREDFDYMQQFAAVTAAAVALEAGGYDPQSLNEVARRSDELGQLARVFQRMAHEVYSREQRLKAEIVALQIEVDEAKKSREVAEITDTPYFQELAMLAKEMRKARK